MYVCVLLVFWTACIRLGDNAPSSPNIGSTGTQLQVPTKLDHEAMLSDTEKACAFLADGIYKSKRGSLCYARVLDYFLVKQWGDHQMCLYKRESTNEYSFVLRGMVLTKWEDGREFLLLMQGKDPIRLPHLFKAFAESVMKIMEDAESSTENPLQINVTGHSLGGYLSSMMVCAALCNKEDFTSWFQNLASDQIDEFRMKIQAGVKTGKIQLTSYSFNPAVPWAMCQEGSVMKRRFELMTTANDSDTNPFYFLRMKNDVCSAHLATALSTFSGATTHRLPKSKQFMVHQRSIKKSHQMVQFTNMVDQEWLDARLTKTEYTEVYESCSKSDFESACIAQDISVFSDLYLYGKAALTLSWLRES